MNSTDKSDTYRTLFHGVPEILNALYFSLHCRRGDYIDLASTVERGDTSRRPVHYHLPLLPRSVIELRCDGPASNEDGVLENEMTIAISWTESAEGDLYGDVEEFSMAGNG
ncbi:hypothetical protein ARMGADRAFT_1092385 [Armillaria gallica]|uniref:Uncharacterized protein n=1 Tax=Armillaria gallica TaxID=47427 RepID=A0A2H3CM75_ARMGA|nr:hypothetical protein ARMGADRAFT_1092385 [Armillaria gallica]